MKQIFNRFYRILKSMNSETSYREIPDDEDFSEAWEELNDFLHDTQHEQKTSSPLQVPEILREDYSTLEIYFGAPFSEVKKKYLQLVKKYHPDRFNQIPAQQLAANEKIKAVNISFHRIEAWERAKTGK